MKKKRKKNLPRTSTFDIQLLKVLRLCTVLARCKFSYRSLTQLIIDACLCVCSVFLSVFPFLDS